MSRKFSGAMLGAAAGFFMTGSIVGGIIGSVIGNMFSGSSDVDYDTPPRRAQTRGAGPDPFKYYGKDAQVQEIVFVGNLVALMMSVAKADKEIHPAEIQAIKNYFHQTLKYTGHDGKVIDDLIRESSKTSLDLKKLCNDTRRMLEIPERLMLVRMLYVIALSDRDFKQVERERIQTIVDYLQVSALDHEHIKNEFKLTASSDHYKVLDLTSSATDAEVKRAYREMVKKYHPDKVSHLGEEFAKLAADKFKAIQQAYDKISKERGL